MLAREIEIGEKYRMKHDELGSKNIILREGSKVKVLRKDGKSIQVKELNKNKLGNGIWWTTSKNIKKLED